MKDTYYLNMKIKQLLFILLTTFLARNLFAEQVGNDAYLEKDVVKIPVLDLGSSQYKLELQLVPNSNPLQLKVIAAEDITALNPNVSGASIFADNILTIPFLADSSSSYKIELVLLSASPSVVLELRNVTTAAWIDRKAISDDAITFTNAKTRLVDLPNRAWKNSQDLLVKNENTLIASGVDLKVLKGPTTQLYFEDNTKAFEKGIKLWANFKQPKEYLALFYSFSDKAWALTQFNNAGLIEAPCTPTVCTGGNSGIPTADGVGVGVFGINKSDSIDPYRYGPLQIHEYSHAAQCAPWIGMNNNPCNEQQAMSPCWLTEGQAHFLGISGNFSTFEEYKENRDNQVNSHKVDSFSDFSASSILQYYDDSIPKECGGKPDYRLGYTLGMLTVEILSAIGGSESTMKIYELAAIGQTFKEAFANVYGISWAEAKPILADLTASLHEDVYM